ncbi:helix-turn-helix domain-containing protein [Streptococcus massiliensis]|uniref:Putative transcriptional repressor n=1 Tax=Streptococcus massiliensis TaxID=313439 RepID=A0A380KY02_9STRE|nr:helix-turn-helix transcriptional regulator [Streptococcus massiliensis]SUN76024.1 putative transcriptional repressor [Streptococcus massiliensis]
MFDHERLKNRRLALNLRPKDIYVILGVTKATYANWESGARVPQEHDIKKLEMIFDVEEDYFIDKTHIVEVFPKLSDTNKRLVETYAHDLYLQQLESER